jgi:hypothetical protein
MLRVWLACAALARLELRGSRGLVEGPELAELHAHLDAELDEELLYEGVGDAGYSGDVGGLAPNGTGVPNGTLAGVAPRQKALLDTAPPPHKVLVMGLQNTGTNLMLEMLPLNFPHLVALKNVERNAFLFKHVKPSEITPEQVEKIREGEVLALAMVRNPLSWLQSTKHNPYHFKQCTRKRNWLTGQCSVCAHRGCAMFGGNGESRPNIESFWNEYNEEYEHLARHGFAAATVVRYEDLVLDTESILQRIAAQTGQKAPKAARQVYDRAKPAGVGRVEAVRKLETKAYLDKYSARERHAACKRLDRDLMRLFGYTDCDGWGTQQSNDGEEDDNDDPLHQRQQLHDRNRQPPHIQHQQQQQHHTRHQQHDQHNRHQQHQQNKRHQWWHPFQPNNLPGVPATLAAPGGSGAPSVSSVLARSPYRHQKHKQHNHHQQHQQQH